MLAEPNPERFSPYRGRETFFQSDEELTERAVSAGIDAHEANFDATAPEAIVTQRSNGEQVLTLRDVAGYRDLLKPVSQDQLNIDTRQLMSVGSPNRVVDPRPDSKTQLQESLARLSSRFSGVDATSIGKDAEQPSLRLAYSEGSSLPEEPDHLEPPDSDEALLDELYDLWNKEQAATVKIEEVTADQLNWEPSLPAIVRNTDSNTARRNLSRFILPFVKRKHMFEIGYYQEGGDMVKFRHVLLGVAKHISDKETYKQQLAAKGDLSPARTEHIESTTQEVETITFSVPKKTERIRNWFRKKTVQASTFVNNTVEKAHAHPTRAAAIIGSIAVATAFVSYKFGVASGRSAGNTEVANNVVNFNPASAPKAIDKGTEFYNWFAQHNPGVSRQQFETIIHSQEFKTLCENAQPA